MNQKQRFFEQSLLNCLIFRNCFDRGFVPDFVIIFSWGIPPILKTGFIPVGKCLCPGIMNYRIGDYSIVVCVELCSERRRSRGEECVRFK